jgi:hypothetical protein
MEREDLHRTAWHLERHGIVGAEPQIAAVVRAARRAGLRPIAVGVLADDGAPEVARIRAFARVAAALDAAPPEGLVAA